jgi:hypothetical protein
MKSILLTMIFTSVLVSQSNQQSEILSETPLHPIPEEMTFEEYRI